MPSITAHALCVERAALAFPGPLLELGAGHASTPFLHALSERLAVPLCTFDNDAAWVAEFAPLRSTLHRVAYVSDWRDVPYGLHPWSVALVDQAPSHARLASLATLRYLAHVVIAHDTEDTRYGYMLAHDWYAYTLTLTAPDEPWVTLFSNYHDVATFWPEVEVSSVSVQLPKLGMAR